MPTVAEGGYAETIGPNIEKYRKLVMISGARVD